MDAKPAFDVFLSYSRPDARTVEDLARRLSDVGLRVWLDRWELAPGEAWDHALADAIEDSTAALVFIGPEGPSKSQQEELRSLLAKDSRGHGRHRVIPVLLPGSSPTSLPSDLSHFVWLDLRNGIEDPNQLARIVNGVRASVKGAPGRSPDRGGSDQGLADSYRSVAETYLSLGQIDQARDALQQSLAIAERLAAAEPDRADYQRDLSVSYSRIGNLYGSLGQGDRARDAYLQSLAIAERLVAAEPDRADYQRDLSVSYNNVGDLYRAMGKIDRARDAYSMALSIRKRLAAAEPDRADYQRDLSVSYNRLGDLYVALGQADRARDAFQQSLAIAERLAAAEPDRADYQRDLSVSYSRIGNLYRSLGQGDRARDAYLQSLAIAERLAAAEPDRADYQRDLVLSLIEASSSDDSGGNDRLLRASTLMGAIQAQGRSTAADESLAESLLQLLRQRGLTSR